MAVDAEDSKRAELKRRFPLMTEMGATPALFRLNGFGTGMYGRRDFDGETRTYVKTYCVSALFVPIFPLGAYRVADAGNGGWYFLGKEPVSGLAKVVRLSMVLVVAGLVASASWSSYQNSPEHRTAVAKKRAAELVATGDALQAAEIYRQAMKDGIGDPAEWRQGMVGLLKSEISSGDPARAASAVAYADERKIVPGSREPLVPDLAELALEAAAKSGNPADEERILSAFQPAPAEVARVYGALRKSLESLHEAKPDDGEVRIKLALIREEFGEVDGALGLLEPAAEQLGDGEGARLFGGLLLGQGRTAEALPHLERYVKPRVIKWQNLEEVTRTTYEESQQNSLNELNRSGGPAGFKARYEAADETEQRQMVDTYLAAELEKDQVFLAARERYQAAGRIVPSIMDLGVAKLRVAQAETDSAKRKEQLKQAEETFLTVKNVAGESDEYRLFLGQIYFWSGREPEGRKLFDELLEAKQRDPVTLYQIGSLFRDLGEDNDARKLLEEALTKTSDVEQKASIIRLRSLLARTIDEKIEWLAKAGGSNPLLAINLAESRAEKAEETGDLVAALRYFREALAGYDKMDRSASTLNNSALVYRSIYRLEGKPADFETAARLLSEAVELASADSILAFNAADSLLTAAVMRVAGEQLDPKLLQFDGSLSALQFLYQNEAEKNAVLERLKADPNFRKSISHFWNSLLLAPKNTGIYAWGLTLFQYLRDEASLERLAAKAAEQEFDFSTAKEENERYKNKERDGEIQASLTAYRAKVKTLQAELKQPKARAFGQCFVSAAQLGGFALGEPLPGGTWLGDLREAAKAAPCSRLNTLLEASLEQVALEKLAKDPECAPIIEANRRLLDTGNILRLLIRSKGALGERVRHEPAVVAAQTEAFNHHDLFPSSFGLSEWLLLDGFNSAANPSLKPLVNANRVEIITSRLQKELLFEGPNALLDQFWHKLLDEDTAGAKELLPKMDATGLKLPLMF